MVDDFNPDDWSNDYTNPNAVASEFQGIRDRLVEIEKRLKKIERFGWVGWYSGCVLAGILSSSRNASILYAILHGILSWVYVIYFALTRR